MQSETVSLGDATIKLALFVEISLMGVSLDVLERRAILQT